MSGHPLDNPIWTSMTSRHAQMTEGGGMARRYPSAISALAGVLEPSAAAGEALAALTPAGEELHLVAAAAPETPVGLECLREAVILQMTATGLVGPAHPFDGRIEPLSEKDEAEMLELALLTRPGPFRTGTPRMGRFLGVRSGGRLVAMAGERMSVDGFHEVSAVCTHPDARGRGLGGALLRAAADRILGEGDTVFLHCYPDNPARSLYEALGFSVRRELRHLWWKKS